MSPSAAGARSFTCSGVLMPKPMQIGNSVCDRIQLTLSIKSAEAGSLAGDAGDGDVIQKHGRAFGDPLARSRGVVGVTS